MKLYTEEQVMIAISSFHISDWTKKHILKTLTPVKLPSDEEIFSVFRGKKMYDNDWEFINGAIWMREQILKQNKKL